MRHIGKYKIRGLLGRGGMGRVFKVLHPEIPRILALKAFSPHPFLLSSVGERKLLTMFHDEASKMALIRHPNILCVEDFFLEEKPCYTMAYHPRSIGMLLGEGGNPEQPCRRMDPDSAIQHIRELLNGLHCLHFHGMIHRDIKPWNLLLDDAGKLILADFGLSRLRHENTGIPENIKVGSPGYAAPEQMKNADTADERSDIYSVGVVFFRMLTGLLPQKSSFGKLLPEPTALWLDFLEKALADNAANRYQDIPSMTRALHNLNLEWQVFKEKECLFRETEPGIRQPPLPLRHLPLHTGVKGDNEKLLSATTLYQPSHFTQNRFRDKGNGCVMDLETRLLWQQSGSPFPMDRKGADIWIRTSRGKTSKQIPEWRLPTVPELFSLIPDPAGKEGLCQTSPLDTRQAWIWSSDTRSPTSAWFVDLVRGFTAPMDRDGSCFVRAVSGPLPSGE